MLPIENKKNVFDLETISSEQFLNHWSHLVPSLGLVMVKL